jgi:hypothetical protein
MQQPFKVTTGPTLQDTNLEPHIIHFLPLYIYVLIIKSLNVSHSNVLNVEK